MSFVGTYTENVGGMPYQRDLHISDSRNGIVISMQSAAVLRYMRDSAMKLSIPTEQEVELSPVNPYVGPQYTYADGLTQPQRLLLTTWREPTHDIVVAGMNQKLHFANGKQAIAGMHVELAGFGRASSHKPAYRTTMDLSEGWTSAHSVADIALATTDGRFLPSDKNTEGVDVFTPRNVADYIGIVLLAFCAPSRSNYVQLPNYTFEHPALRTVYANVRAR